ncbi:PREDICTED: endogenous retrovirus group K member 11 Pol protein-like [Tinamus guttatus]|nr:PREDICTED: endogenous retrovirus group K member 11 Pol protein-like [Tinamus guttatus]
MGLFVLPGVIDADYTGEIQIMAYTPYPPLKIERGQPAIAWTFPIPITWITEEPVMVKQWPLKRESLEQAHMLVKEQLQQGHLRLSTSPWNTPIFVIKKKSGKYRLLHDLRAVNSQMEPMGALQPGLPNPAMIPENWPILIIDLKDCFYTINLHPNDSKRFAFTLPAINRGEPDKRFEWTVLPQGMRNSPTLCQLYVDAALQPLRQKMSDTVIYHYMDDILFARSREFTEEDLRGISTTLAQYSLVVAPEKIQRSTPWKYLGWTITEQKVRPQKLLLDVKISTLHEAQKLLGDLQWLKPVTGIPNTLLQKLQPLLKGTDPCTPVIVTPTQEKALQHIGRCITDGFVSRRIQDCPIDLTIWHGDDHLLGALTQYKKETGEPRVLEWLSPPLQSRKTIIQKIENLAKLIQKGRLRVIEVTGREPAVIHLPIEKPTLDWFLRLRRGALGPRSRDKDRIDSA